MTNEQLKLYPLIEPYDQGFMSVEGHEIYYEQCGNPDGKACSLLAWRSWWWWKQRCQEDFLILIFIGLWYLISVGVEGASLIPL